MGLKAISVLLIVLLISGCARDKPASKSISNVSSLQISVASSSLTPNENRMVVTLWDGSERISDVKTVLIRAHDLEQEDSPIVWEGMAANYTDYAVPYWVVYPNFAHAGSWLFDIVVERNSGEIVNGTVAANVYAEASGVGVGMPAPPSESRTWDGNGDLSTITSDSSPNTAFYAQTIAKAVSSGRATIIAFTTPGFCTSRICTPVTDTIDALWETYQDKLNFVHIEVYEDFETLKPVSTMQEWGLTREPWVYLIDGDGIVAARYDGPLSVREITPIIQELLNGS
ncbi:MAG: hypothetical protein K8L91_27000 [Anaerolineae bacterium]|nr:hypothetical protein [Anaerolineae bacterium]